MEYIKLTNANIDMLSEKVGEMYAKAGCTRKEILRAKLLLEECLLKYQERFGEDTEIFFRTTQMFWQLRMNIRIRCASFDPFAEDENPMAIMFRTLISNLENGLPTWKYQNQENEILFVLQKKATVNSLTKLIIAIAASVVLGILARLILPAAILSTIAKDYLEPISDAYAGIFCVMAVLLTFFAIVMSIVHTGDIAAVGALGGKIMKRFLLVSSVAAIVLTIPILPFFTIQGIGKFAGAAKSLYDIIVGFIPTNIVAPFLNFNPVHIMIIGAMFGFSLLAMGQKGDTLSKVFDECNIVAIYTNTFLNKFIFIYVAIKVFTIIINSNFLQLFAAGEMVGVIVIAELIIVAAYSIYTCIKTKKSFKEYSKIIMPATLVSLSSANFGAAFSTIVDSMLGAKVDGDVVNFSVNLGSVFFQPACTVVFIFSSFFMAAQYDVQITVIWIISSVILSIVLVGTMPNVPGASVAVITLLYAQLGIPASGLAMIITINALLQFLTVGVDVWCLQSEILCLDQKLKA